MDALVYAIDDAGLRDVEASAIPGPGSCGGMYTANTMATCIEALGMSLPNSSAPIALSRAKQQDCRNAGAAVLKKDCHLGAKYRRLCARTGSKMKSRMAIARKLLVIVYHILSNGIAYREFGNDYFDRRSKDALASRMKRRLEALGQS